MREPMPPKPPVLDYGMPVPSVRALIWRRVRERARWFLQTHEGHFCLLVVSSTFPIMLQVATEQHREPFLDLLRSYSTDSLTALAALAYTLAFWPAVIIVHFKPFDQARGVSIRRLPTRSIVEAVSAATLLIGWLGNQSQVESTTAIIDLVPLCWLLTLLARRRPPYALFASVAALVGILATNTWIHRCEHMTVVRLLGVEALEIGERPCHNRDFHPWWSSLHP